MLKEIREMKQEQQVIKNENIKYEKYNTWSNIYIVQFSIATPRYEYTL